MSVLDKLRGTRIAAEITKKVITRGMNIGHNIMRKSKNKKDKARAHRKMARQSKRRNRK